MLQLQPDDYKVNLEVFEGPLDLLLYLIRRDELDIYDIPIAHIADEYAKHLQLMKMLDLNLAGEFIVMAATLSYIKSRMLLPAETRPDEQADGADEGKDPRWDLVQQLLAYKKFKDAADSLLELERHQQNMFSPQGDPMVAEEDLKQEKTLGEIGIFDLIEAFHAALERAPATPIIGEIEPIRWRVSDKIDAILGLTASKRRVGFSELFTKDSPRGEIIVTFLALLELLRLRQVAVTQPEPFTEIIVSKVPEGTGEADLPAPVIGGTDHA